MTSGANTQTSGQTAQPTRGLFRNPDFLVPYLAEAQSIGGDQVGRVALSILVFDRTASVVWTAFTYALTYLPAILGGFFLGGIGDRFPRVWVMVATDVARAALFVGVAIPGVPLAVIVTLVAIAFFLGPAFTAAMVSRLAAVLVPEQFRAASGIRMISSQTVQVAGFAVGGIVVAAIDTRAALLINAATFAVSALVVAVALGPTARRAAPTTAATAPATAVPVPAEAPLDVGTGTASSPPPQLWRDPVLRSLVLMTALAGFFVVPEGLAVPVARHLGAPSEVAGLLLAAGPLGSAVGAALLVKFVPPRRDLRTARAMSIACGVPLVATAALSAWPWVVVCWAISGALWAYQIDVAAALVHAIDDSSRSRTIGRASAVLLGVQGVGLIAFGGIGGWLGPQRSVALAGVLGVCCAGAVTWAAVRGDVRPAP